MFTLLVNIETTFSSIIVITLITLIFTIFLKLPVTNNIFNALFLQQIIHRQILPCSQEDIKLLLPHLKKLRALMKNLVAAALLEIGNLYKRIIDVSGVWRRCNSIETGNQV